MQISSVNLNNFRNIKSVEIPWSPDCNILLGRNGQGKTSVLEALYFLGSGRSFRTNSNSELVSFSEEKASISCSVISSRMDLETVLSAEINKKLKTKFFLHQKETALTRGYLGKLIVVAFVPNDTKIVRGAPSERRRFIDKHIVDIYPNQLEILMRYNRALKSKLALLADRQSSPGLLDPWDSILAETGAKITAAREKFVSELSDHIGSILPLFAPADGKIEISLKKNLMPESTQSAGAQDYFKEILAIRGREIASGRALIGPHRDDVNILLSGVAARDFSSQGQARTITLLLKLAVIELIEAKTGESPVVLLDDVDSELDDDRAKFLFSAFSEQKRQIFISSTTQSNLWPKNAGFFNVHDGQIEIK